MIFDWLIPPDYDDNAEFLQCIDYFSGDASELEPGIYDAYMLGITTQNNTLSINNIRKRLQEKGSAYFKNFKVFDFGNLIILNKKDIPGFINYFLKELKAYHEAKPLILLTDYQNWSLYHHLTPSGKYKKNISIISSFIPDEISSSIEHFKIHIYILGIQNYLIKKEQYEKLQAYQNKIKLVRLSELNEIIESEPFLRNSVTTHFQYESLAFSEIGVSSQANTIGFNAAQWAALAYYSGISPINKSIVFDIPSIDKDRYGNVSEIISISIWHYLWGLYNKLPDYPFLAKDNLQKIILNKNGEKFVFYTNPVTGRWWKYKNEVLEPCSRNLLVRMRDEI